MEPVRIRNEKMVSSLTSELESGKARKHIFLRSSSVKEREGTAYSSTWPYSKSKWTTQMHDNHALEGSSTFFNAFLSGCTAEPRERPSSFIVSGVVTAIWKFGSGEFILKVRHYPGRQGGGLCASLATRNSCDLKAQVLCLDNLLCLLLSFLEFKKEQLLS